MKNRGRRAYFTRKLPSLNQHAVAEIADSVSYLTEGNEGYGSQSSVIRKRLANFDPKQDVIVPTGPSWINVLLGLELARMYPGQLIRFGVYSRRRDQYSLVQRVMEDVAE